MLVVVFLVLFSLSFRFMVSITARLFSAPKAAPVRCGPNELGEEVIDGKCLYLQHQMLTVGQAQRVCARLGGDLAAIESQAKQVGQLGYFFVCEN